MPTKTISPKLTTVAQRVAGIQNSWSDSEKSQRQLIGEIRCFDLLKLLQGSVQPADNAADRQALVAA